MSPASRTSATVLAFSPAGSAWANGVLGWAETSGPGPCTRSHLRRRCGPELALPRVRHEPAAGGEPVTPGRSRRPRHHDRECLRARRRHVRQSAPMRSAEAPIAAHKNASITAGDRTVGQPGNPATLRSPSLRGTPYRFEVSNGGVAALVLGGRRNDRGMLASMRYHLSLRASLLTQVLATCGSRSTVAVVFARPNVGLGCRCGVCLVDGDSVLSPSSSDPTRIAKPSHHPGCVNQRKVREDGGQVGAGRHGEHAADDRRRVDPARPGVTGLAARRYPPDAIAPATPPTQ
jgi:hypothetical protein